MQGVGLPLPEVENKKEPSSHLWDVKRRGALKVGVTYFVLLLLLVFVLGVAQFWLTLPDWSWASITMLMFITISMLVWEGLNRKD